MNYEKFYKMAVQQATPEEEEQFAEIGKTYPETQWHKSADEKQKSSTETTKDSTTSANTTTPAESKKEAPETTGPKWNEHIGNVYGWNEQLPMLALLAGTGALGGWALSSKKKKGSGAAFGAISLPALYAAYVASRRNGILPSKPDSDDFLDKGFNKINDAINPWLPNWFNKQV